MRRVSSFGCRVAGEAACGRAAGSRAGSAIPPTRAGAFTSTRNLKPETRTPIQLPRRGTALIVTMIVCFALAGMVLALCRSMRVELMAAGNQVAAVQADAIVRAGEQYVLGVLTTEGQDVVDLAEDQFSAVPVGDGYFWVMRPDYDDAALPAFGLVAESAKINLNTTGFEELMALPNMTDELASAIVEWRTADAAGGGGVGSGSYVKGGPFETVEELLMVSGATRQYLYGDGTAPPLGTRSGQLGFGGGLGSAGSANATVMGGGSLTTDPQVARGMYDLLTVLSVEPNTTVDGQPRLNIQNRDATARQQLRDLLNRELGGSRGNQIVDRLGRERPDDIFVMARLCNMTSAELDKVADFLTSRGGNTLQGRININTAPRAALMCLRGLDAADVDKLIAARTNIDPQSTAVGWVLDALGEKSEEIGNQVTTRSFQWSADILGVSGNGRMFKRVRIVIDARSGTPQIIYRRDLTDRGWPMDRQVLASIRAGQGAGNNFTGAGNGMGMGGGSSRGVGSSSSGGGLR